MAFVPIVGGCKVEELFTFDSGPDAALVWGVDISVAVLDVTLATSINAAFELFWTHSPAGLSLDGARSNKSTRTERIITDVRTETGPQFTFFPNITGGNSGDPLPTGTSLVLKLQSGTRGRSYRGRKYLPGLCEGNNTTDAKPDSGIITVAQDAAGALITGLNPTSPLAVLSRKLGTAEVVLSTSVDAIWHYQRRRAR